MRKTPAEVKAVLIGAVIGVGIWLTGVGLIFTLLVLAIRALWKLGS